jgi:ribosome-associated heat shock protein Hsp15
VSGVRLDRWLWSVRLTKTRTDATDACRAGHVRVNGRPAKAAHPVSAGDRVEARIHGSDRIVEVVRTIENRVGAPIAVE